MIKLGFLKSTDIFTFFGYLGFFGVEKETGVRKAGKIEPSFGLVVVI